MNECLCGFCQTGVQLVQRIRKLRIRPFECLRLTIQSYLYLQMFMDAKFIGELNRNLSQFYLSFHFPVVGCRMGGEGTGIPKAIFGFCY